MSYIEDHDLDTEYKLAQMEVASIPLEDLIDDLEFHINDKSKMNPYKHDGYTQMMISIIEQYRQMFSF